MQTTTKTKLETSKNKLLRRQSNAMVCICRCKIRPRENMGHKMSVETRRTPTNLEMMQQGEATVYGVEMSCEQRNAINAHRHERLPNN